MSFPSRLVANASYRPTLVETNALVRARERTASAAVSFSEAEACSREMSKVPTSAPKTSSRNLSCSPGANCTAGAGTAAQGGGGTAASRTANGASMWFPSCFDRARRFSIRRTRASGDSTDAQLLHRGRDGVALRRQHLDAGGDPLSHRGVSLRVAREAAHRRSERPRLVVRELRVPELPAQRKRSEEHT